VTRSRSKTGDIKTFLIHIKWKHWRQCIHWTLSDRIDSKAWRKLREHWHAV